jgi:hypothetical protein
MWWATACIIADLPVASQAWLSRTLLHHALDTRTSPRWIRPPDGQHLNHHGKSENEDRNKALLPHYIDAELTEQLQAEREVLW